MLNAGAQMNCPKCNAECEGEDLGDHQMYLSYECECGYMWNTWEGEVLGEQ